MWRTVKNFVSEIGGKIEKKSVNFKRKKKRKKRKKL